MPDQRLLLHVSGTDAAHIQTGLRNARNARAQLPALTVEVVVQGPCVAFLAAGSMLDPDLTALNDEHLRVVACNNSMQSAGLEASSLHARVGVVPAAVAHLATRQFTGWAYVRA